MSRSTRTLSPVPPAVDIDPADVARPVNLRAPAAAAFLGVSPGTLANWRSAGTGPSYSRIHGSRIVYAFVDLASYVAASRVEA